jgi:hypothetical protein
MTFAVRELWMPPRSEWAVVENAAARTRAVHATRETVDHDR